MSSLYFPVASIFISILLNIIFFKKQREENVETEIYSKMLLINIFETITAIFIVVIAKTIGTINLLYLLDRIDFILISLWCSMLFLYVYNVSVTNPNKKIISFNYLISIFLCGIFFVSNFEIINVGDSIDTAGLAPTIVGVVAAIYTVAMLACLLAKIFNKEEKLNLRKYYPLFVFIVLISFSLFMRKIWPTMVLEPFMISFINLIMYFTIENPDLKMIEQLAIEKSKAEKYSKDKAVFLFNMSQQIREPLKAIDKKSDEILELEDIEKIKENISSIKSSLNVLQYVVNNSLDISNIEAKHLNIKENKYDLRNLVKEVSLRLVNEINQSKITFNCNISEDLPEKLYGDSIKMKQIINTLLFNSAKHTDVGYIELNISSVIKRDICRLIIKVEDSGKGISAYNLNKIFEKHDVEECSIDNRTLTLDTLKKMINLIGGTIMVNSELGVGTEFTVMLEQKIVETTKDKITKSVEKYKNIKKITVLLISNKEELIKDIKNQFDNKKYEVTSVKGGEAALKKLRNNEKFSLIFIDEDLDKLDCITTYERMKQIESFESEVIIITANNDKYTKIKYENIGFSDVLLNPINKEQIKEIIKKYTKKI